MLTATTTLLHAARAGAYAIGAFNVYNLEGARAVAAAAEETCSPALLQIHPGALNYGGAPLIALCLAVARDAAVPMAVHLDHSTSAHPIGAALASGCASIMADGSHLSYSENIAFTAEMAALAHVSGAAVEAELGRLSGTEDGLTVEEYEALLTDPVQAAGFVARTGIDALAVCIGNVHGRYRGEPALEFDRLAAITNAVDVPLVLHGASGLPDAMVQRAIELGVCKFNVNTEVREAYMNALREGLDGSTRPDLLDLLEHVTAAMQAVVSAQLRLFGSTGRG